MHPPRLTIAPIGNSVSCDNVDGSISSPVAFKSFAIFGSCCGVHMPSFAQAMVVVRAREASIGLMRVLRMSVFNLSDPEK